MNQSFSKVKLVFKSGSKDYFAILRKNLTACIDSNSSISLVLEDDHLYLKDETDKKASGVSVDFANKTLLHRIKFGGGFGEDLAKAVSLSTKFTPTILDASAGLGRDAFVLASLGSKVSLLERNDVVYHLLENGIARGTNNLTVSSVVARLKLLEKNSWNKIAENSFDVVYFDPMFPHKQKSALVKKEMRIFQSLVGADLDSDLFLDKALKIAKKRVVIKRPDYAPFLNNQKPDFSRKMKNHRFDIYLVSNSK